MNEKTSVYLYYDKLGVLLYVGITKRGPVRNDEHTAKEWWPFVARQEIEHHDSRDVALARETMLIRQNRPPFNKQQNPEHPRLRAAYLTLFGPRTPPAFTGDDCLGCEDEGEHCMWPNIIYPHNGREFDWRDVHGCCADSGCSTCHGKWHGYEEGLVEGHESGAQHGYDAGVKTTRKAYFDLEMSHAVLSWVIDHRTKEAGVYITGPHDPISDLRQVEASMAGG